MGCDIHLYVERLVEGHWQAVANPDEPDSDQYRNWLWDGRSYRLFAILADVRNYDGLEPISEARGLPEDVSEPIRQLASGAPDCHSFTWLGVGELLDFEWESRAGEMTRCVPPEEAEAFRKTGTKPLNYALASATWPELTWEVTYRDCASGLLEALERLRALAEPQDLRLVFWFDN
jgi:hypothetical protein